MRACFIDLSSQRPDPMQSESEGESQGIRLSREAATP